MSDLASRVTLVEHSCHQLTHTVDRHNELLHGTGEKAGLAERTRKLEDAEVTRTRSRRLGIAVLVGLASNVVVTIVQLLVQLLLK